MNSIAPELTKESRTPEGTPPYRVSRGRKRQLSKSPSRRRRYREKRYRVRRQSRSSRSSSNSRSRVRYYSRRRNRGTSRSSSSIRISPQRDISKWDRINKQVSHSRHFSDSDSSVSSVLDNNYSCAKKRRGLAAATNTESAPTVESRLLEKLVDVLKDRNSGSVGPVMHGAQNVIPDFDPQAKSQTMKDWLSKINESSHVYGWSERQTILYALPKLKGLAKRWYDGLTSVSFSWVEWQLKLKTAFPCEQNYGDLLSEMLFRKTRRNEPLEEYYYDKIMLINKCGIQKKQAVDCLSHGIFDWNIRMNVQGADLQEPEEVLKYFRNISSSKISEISRKVNFRDNNDGSYSKSHNEINNAKKTNQVTCYNCGAIGHTVPKCPKEVIKCNKCRRFGHTENNCTGYRRFGPNTEKREMATNASRDANAKNILNIMSTDCGNDKYFKQIKLNGQSMSCFIDFGSQCTLIRDDYASKLRLTVDRTNLPILKGFASGTLVPHGRVTVNIALDALNVEVEAYLVEPKLLPADVLVGQSLTEQPGVRAHKTDTMLILYKDITTDLDKIPVIVSNNVLITGLDTIEVHTTSDFNGSLYFATDASLKVGKEYMVVPGVYSFKNGKGSMNIIKLATEPFKLTQGTLVARAKLISRTQLPDAPLMDKSVLKVNTVSVQSTPNIISSEQLNVDHDLNPDVKEQLCKLLNARRDCFAFTLEELGDTPLTEMHIRLKDDEPITYRPYRLAISEREKVNTIIGDMLANGIIRESQSEYASPIILVAKKNGDVRLCVDYRALNRKTIKDKFPMPLIDDQIDSLSGQVYFTSLDLTSGYHQVPVSEESKPLTAFVTPDGHYEYNRMPFGLTNAPAVFQRLIQKNLKRRNIPGVLAYMDDIIIASKSVEEGMEKLHGVFDLLKEANLTLNLTKCNFFKKSIDYLGFEITRDGVRPGMRKIEAVAYFKTPQNVHEVRQFVGLSSFFRRFVPGFATIAKPLTSLTKSNVKWSWGSEQVNAFAELKRILTTRPVLAIYNPIYETELHTDASSMGLGGVLLQRPSSATALQPVAYFSRQTSVEEQNFHSYELETLAVVASLERFRVYLLGIDFKIITDCSALRTTLTKRDLIPRIARWWLLVQEFTFSIEHRPGTQLAHADALSRNPIPVCDSSWNNSVVDLTVLQLEEVHWLQAVQMSDPRLCHIKAVLDNSGQEAKDIRNNYLLKDGKIYRKLNGELRWAVPKEARWKICQQCHDNAGHFSFEKTLEKMRRDYWFPRLTQFVKKYVRACIPCAHAKLPGGKKQGFLHAIPKPSTPFQCLHIDHLGPFVKSKRGNVYILGIIDSFTKFIILKTVKTTKSKTSITALRDVFGLFGTPRHLISDRGTSFTSHEFKVFMDSLGIKHTLNAVATPRANGQIERYNRSILASLIALCHGKDDRDWDLNVTKVQWSLNNTINQSTGKSPTEIIFGHNSINEAEGHLHDINVSQDTSTDKVQKIRAAVSANIKAQQEKMKTRYDKKRCKAKVYKIGDLVMAQKSAKTPGESQKLVPAFSGPFRVTAVLDHDRYEISSIDGYSKNKYKNIFPVDKIKPWMRFVESESESEYGSSGDN